MASFVAVVVGFFGGFFFGGGGGCYVLFKKGFVLFVCLFVCFLFSFFDGKSVMSALCIYYHMCMFV